ncbi:hypothetical protein A2524_04380 [Candidatus Wolfebacteria bacterium RIFOXYD12_FULL_48_21]|uniref:DUF5678 domain-containing protein n=1 Tax=Candidatus Wolfebacteria bacterium RIFOXYD1_FULL_48_65 TaxID=1802561 RepID=A0A1F8E399_9BACT|nr:MAG: hypothetical protein A2610_03460 [Candidatus Wolfebacteria bacterium RIFOXYD1_FULL_48_65]OGM95282.1 MAG: hypothetical protein A2524_04380 [Candidatus Wolfebacteria bacterium RIFOXYD12_FULL_48_21]OGM96851.1 MAG: hypothetical protein A2532_01740 [Candidatus Wolfebacteria bacterium RIFOXYD2_FULL_48_11]
MNTVRILSEEDRQLYQGKFVALDDWSHEGSPARVVAAGKTIKDLEGKLSKIGKSFWDVIVFYVSPEKKTVF